MKTMRLNITKTDIAKATEAATTFAIAEVSRVCPIAQSLRRKFPRREIIVSWSFFQVGKQRRLLPDSATNFMERWKPGKTPPPITLVLPAIR
jgi:hypothetical protein